MFAHLALRAAAAALVPLLAASPAPAAPANAAPANAAPANAAPAKVAAFAPTRFSVVVEGQGADVILIPGLASPRAVWDGARAALGGRYRLHLVQMNGFGGTAPGVNASGAILAPTVEELHRYIAANRLKAPAVVGHSMGGLLGLMLAQAHPQSVGKLMIVDALPFIGTLFNPDATVASVTPQATMMRDAMLAAAKAQRGKPRRAVDIPFMSITPAGTSQVNRWSAEADPSVSARAMYEDMTTDMRPALPAIRTPITVLYPYSSRSFGADRAKAIYGTAYESAPNARLVPVPESFHFIMLDRLAAFAAALRGFLETKT